MGRHTRDHEGTACRKCRFMVTHLPDEVLRGVCRDLGLDGDPAETLRVAYAVARPRGCRQVSLAVASDWHSPG